jgi:hypothetical protein
MESRRLSCQAPFLSNEQTKELIRPLLLAAISRNIQISAEEHRLCKDLLNGGMEFKDLLNDPIVTWINEFMPGHMRYSPATPFHTYPDAVFEDDLGNKFRLSFYRNERFSEVPKSVWDAEQLRLQTVLGNIPPNPCKYQLIPECRKCHDLFGTWDQLKAHLDKYPRHKRTYHAKKLNKPAKYDHHRPKNICITCGKCFEGPKRLAEHLHDKGHARWGVIPRYAEDNHAWNERDRKLWEKRMPGTRGNILPSWMDPY